MNRQRQRFRVIDCGLEDKRARHTGLEIGTIALIVGATAAVAGAGVSIYSAVKQANETADLSDIISEQKTTEAAAVRESAAGEETQARRRSAILLGRQHAIQAAAGIDPNYGSPLLDTIDTIEQTTLEQMNIRRIGELAASEREFEGAIAKYRGQSARDTIPYTIAGGALSATAGVASTYATYAQRTRSSTLSTWTD